jgi:hypothetical protein
MLGVLEAYRNCIRQVQLSGPTNFSPVINHVARFASTYKDGSSYFILLILTDGVITDMPQTTQVIHDMTVQCPVLRCSPVDFLCVKTVIYIGSLVQSS